jgi:ribosomal biogenesis protein LAS1
MPSLAELKRAAKESLDWLWEWYWSHLEAAFASSRSGDGGHTNRELREILQGILKSYVRERKAEIKRRGKADTKAAESAVASLLSTDAAHAAKWTALLDLLVTEKAILPADKKLGSNMSGAFLIWDPFLVTLCRAMPNFPHDLLDRIVEFLSRPVPGTLSVESDPEREGLDEWCTHLLASGERKAVRQKVQTGRSSSTGTSTDSRLLEHVLESCLTAPTPWTLRLAEALLKDAKFTGRDSWLAILEAARSEDVDVDMDEAISSVQSTPDVGTKSPPKTKPIVQKLRGPQKKVGLWRPLPIGTLIGGE